jgi:aromatic-L-amino-acid decarboxylase
MPDKSEKERFTGDMAPDEFRKWGRQMVEWIAHHMEHLDEVPVLPAVRPGEIARKLPQSPPETGESMKSVLADVDRIVMPGMTHWNHPGFLAYFSITGSGPGILGELLSAAFNINAMLWKTCPSATELEQTVLAWLRQMMGLPDSFWGILYDTASVSTFHALAAAREALHPDIRRKGMAGRADLPPMRVYCSEQAHSSVDKAVIALGLGLEGISKIPVDDDFRMIPERLAEAVRTDRSAGIRPLGVVATVGTTSTTSIDPVPEIADICREHGIWLHVDAAYGGTAAIVPEYRHVLSGVENADSMVVNPHKWLFVPIDCSAFFTRKPGMLKQAFSLVAEYLRTPEDREVENLMDYGLQLGRRFRALKLWFVMRYFGRQGLIRRIRNHISLTKSMAGWIENHSDFQLMAPVPFSTICFRACPPGIKDENDLDRLNERLLNAVNDSRRIYLSHTKLRGRFVLRMAIGNLHTREEHLILARNVLSEQLERLLAS